jgi:CHAT domain-containing protein
MPDPSPVPERQGRAAIRMAVVEYYVLPRSTAAFVVRADREEPIVEELDLSRDTVRTAAHRLIEDLSPANINPTHPEWSADLEFLEPLARRLLDRIWPHLEEIELLCIVPHGDLFYLPFHALRLASGRHLIEELPIVYAPSAALAINARLHRRPSRPATFIGFGTGKADDPPARREGFEREVLAISGMPVWENPDPLTGVAASCDAFLQRAGHADVVHCACHGHFDARDPLSSGLLLADAGQLPEWMAGAEPDRRFIVSARTLAAGSLQAHLVYLSACVSGRHDIGPGDEILGLVRALIRAGAASIVASLWPIAAWSPTRLLMETFYARWVSGGGSKAKAMQAAQLETMRRHPHPYHWAPFTLFGDWC